MKLIPMLHVVIVDHAGLSDLDVDQASTDPVDIIFIILNFHLLNSGKILEA